MRNITNEMMLHGFIWFIIIHHNSSNCLCIWIYGNITNQNRDVAIDYWFNHIYARKGVIMIFQPDQLAAKMTSLPIAERPTISRGPWIYSQSFNALWLCQLQPQTSLRYYCGHGILWVCNIKILLNTKIATSPGGNLPQNLWTYPTAWHTAYPTTPRTYAMCKSPWHTTRRWPRHKLPLWPSTVCSCCGCASPHSIQILTPSHVSVEKNA